MLKTCIKRYNSQTGMYSNQFNSPSLEVATLRGGTKAVAKLAVHGATILAYAAKAAGGAATKAGSKAAFKAGAKAGAKAVFKLGYRAAASGTAVGAIGGIAIGVNVLFEGPLLARGPYKLHQKKKFGIISECLFLH